jgi:hypothetical protein
MLCIILLHCFWNDNNFVYASARQWGPTSSCKDEAITMVFQWKEHGNWNRIWLTKIIGSLPWCINSAHAREWPTPMMETMMRHREVLNVCKVFSLTTTRLPVLYQLIYMTLSLQKKLWILRLKTKEDKELRSTFCVCIYEKLTSVDKFPVVSGSWPEPTPFGWRWH